MAMPSSEAIRAASTWFARLQAGPVDAADRQAWERWLAAKPAHRRAWELVEEVRAQLDQVPAPHSASQALDAAGRARRRALGQLAVLLGVGTAGAVFYRTTPWREWTADYRTSIGERRHLMLPDGSALSMNTASAIDVAFSTSERLIHLHAGEVLIATAPDPAVTARPFRVRTQQGEVLALGTRFTVRSDGDAGQVAVLEKAVRVQPADSGESMIVSAGSQLRFEHDRLGRRQANDASVGSWQEGSIVAVNMPLRRLVAELARYRPGYLGCGESVAELKISGAFPIDDTDRALAALTRSFPVQVTRRTRYWVLVESR